MNDTILEKENQFIELINKNLTNNGFPHKRVGLPLEKMYEVASNRGVNFNNILSRIAEEQEILHEKETDRIVFFKEAPVNHGPSMDDMKNMKFDREKVDEMMKDVSPEQMEEAKKMFENMSEQEKQNLMDQAKQMGLF